MTRREAAKQKSLIFVRGESGKKSCLLAAQNSIILSRIVKHSLLHMYGNAQQSRAEPENNLFHPCAKNKSRRERINKTFVFDVVRTFGKLPFFLLRDIIRICVYMAVVIVLWVLRFFFSGRLCIVFPRSALPLWAFLYYSHRSYHFQFLLSATFHLVQPTTVDAQMFHKKLQLWES